MSSTIANQGRDPSTAYARWIQAAGVSAMLSALFIFGAAILNIGTPPGGSSTTAALPLNFYTSLLNGALDGWLAIAGVIFLLLASLGMFFLLNRPEAPVWIAPVSIAVGSLFLLLGYVLTIFTVRQLEPHLAGGVRDARATFMAMAGTVYTTSSLMLVIGSGLTFGLGVGLFGLFGLQSASVPSWAGWLGISAGLLHVGWLDALAPSPLSTYLSTIKLFDLLLFLIWLVTMGIILFQHRSTTTA